MWQQKFGPTDARLKPPPNLRKICWVSEFNSTLSFHDNKTNIEFIQNYLYVVDRKI